MSKVPYWYILHEGTLATIYGKRLAMLALAVKRTRILKAPVFGYVT